MGGVLLVLLTVIISVAFGLVRGGETGRLAEAELRFLTVLVIGLALQFGATIASVVGILTSVAPWMWVLGMACTLAFAVVNQRQPGMLMLAFGLFCNLLAVTLNGGMPVTDVALARAGITLAGGPAADRPDALHVLADAGTRLPFLADVLAVRPLRTVVSIGDIAQYAGLFLLIQGVMVRGARAGRPPRYELFDYRVR
jgi:Family of unknown function (DUF5317)